MVGETTDKLKVEKEREINSFANRQSCLDSASIRTENSESSQGPEEMTSPRIVRDGSLSPAMGNIPKQGNEQTIPHSDRTICPTQMHTS